MSKKLDCSICKTTKTNAWYKDKNTDSSVICNLCCDSSGSIDPNDWIGLCVKCLMSEAAYPIYTAGFKQYACCKCYLDVRQQIKALKSLKSKQKDGFSTKKKTEYEKKRVIEAAKKSLEQSYKSKNEGLNAKNTSGSSSLPPEAHSKSSSN